MKKINIITNHATECFIERVDHISGIGQTTQFVHGFQTFNFESIIAGFLFHNIYRMKRIQSSEQKSMLESVQFYLILSRRPRCSD